MTLKPAAWMCSYCGAVTNDGRPPWACGSMMCRRFRSDWAVANDTERLEQFVPLFTRDDLVRVARRVAKVCGGQEVHGDDIVEEMLGEVEK